MYGEPLILSGVEQRTVYSLRPSALVCCHDFMLREYAPQRNRSALVEEYPHLCRGEGATRRMLQDGTCLLDRDLGKPFDEL